MRFALLIDDKIACTSQAQHWFVYCALFAYVHIPIDNRARCLYQSSSPLWPRNVGPPTRGAYVALLGIPICA